MSAVRSIGDLPAPPGLPLIGNLHQLGGLRRAHLTIERWSERYGAIYTFRVGPWRTVVVSDAEEINRVLRERPNNYRRVEGIESVFSELGVSGVFSVEGDTWRRQRRLAIAALNSNHLHRHFHVIRTAAERLHRRLREAARAGRSIDICEVFNSYSLDIVATLAFGQDINSLERHDAELQHHIEVWFATLNSRFLSPIPYWRWLRLPADRAAERSVAQLKRAGAAFIEHARARMLARPELLEAPENFLEAMLATQQLEDGFTDEEVVGNVFTLLVAGEDTTAHTLAWTSWFVAQREDVQTRLADEASELLGDDLFPTDHGQIERFVYGEAVLRESIRLKPASTGQVVQPVADTTVCDAHIPAGTPMFLNARYVARRADGPDFDPARWLEEGREKPDPKLFLAFGAGPRFCPGRNLAFLESKTAIAMIVRNFELELDQSGGPVREHLAFTMGPEGLRVRLRERASARRARRQDGRSAPARA